MNKETIFDDEHLVLQYSSQDKLMVQTWKGMTLKETFTGLLDIAFRAISDKKPTGILMDAREHKGLGPDAHEKIAQKLNEYAKMHGKIKQALLLPDDIFSRVSVENFSKRMGAEDSLVITGMFKDYNEAEAWLLKN